MQQIQVQAIGREATQAALARRDGAFGTRVVRINLADEEHLVAAAGDRVREQFLGAAVTVHLGGIEQPEAGLDARVEGLRLACAMPSRFTHAPRAKPEYRRVGAIGKTDGGNGLRQDPGHPARITRLPRASRTMFACRSTPPSPPRAASYAPRARMTAPTRARCSSRSKTGAQSRSGVHRIIRRR